MRRVLLMMIALVAVLIFVSTAAAQGQAMNSVLQTAVDAVTSPAQPTGSQEVPEAEPVQTPQPAAIFVPVIPLQPIGYLRTTVRPMLFGSGTVTRERFVPYRCPKPCLKTCLAPVVPRPASCCGSVQPPIIQQVQVKTFVPKPVYGTQTINVITGYTYEEVKR